MTVTSVLTQAFLVGLLASTVRVALPLLTAGLGEIFAERSGVLNVGVEGMMLVGALGAFLGSYFGHSAWVGLAVGMLSACALGIVHAYLSITLGANQVVSGIAINIMALGIATLTNRAVFGADQLPPKVDGFPVVSIPVISDIPLLGPVLFQHHVLVFIGFALVPVSYVVLFKTTQGLKVTAAGESPRAADTAGIDVSAVRYGCVIVGALLAGFAGASLSLGQLNMFRESMIAGRGFIAIAVVVFGRWHPFGALGAALFFGLAEAAQLRLQALGLTAMPSQFLVSLPYLVTLIVVVAGIGRGHSPSALAIPYLRQQSR